MITIELSRNIIKKYVEVTTPVKVTSNDKTVYGTISGEGDELYVKLDGSDVLTPISSAIDVRDGDRVLVLIKNHEAMVLGSPTSPTARLEELRKMGDQITEFGVIIADKVGVGELVAIQALIDELTATDVEITGKLEANDAKIENLTAENATITGKLEAIEADIDNLDVENLDAKYASIARLESVEAEIENLDVDNLDARYASIERLEAVEAEIENLDVENLDAKYVNIDLANVDQAWFDEFHAKSGIIENVVIDEGVVAKELVGVTIKGDLIEAGTLKADRLVVKGSDGNYYKLSTDFEAMPGVTPIEEDAIHGSVLVSKSITAEKVDVHDLVAFGATIGGFKITDSSIYSGVKASVDNTTLGIYLDNEGQLALGDDVNFLKYYKDQNGNYKLAISADNIKLGTTTVTEEGVSKVKTTTGYAFDDGGLTIDAPDAATKTQVTSDGMIVHKKGAEKDEQVLTATSDGVNATNLHATTFLIVGGRSRFENYGEDRTGCFWIGG